MIQQTTDFPLYPERTPKIKVTLDGNDLEADHQIQFYSALTCNSSRALSDLITLAIDDSNTDINEDTTQGVNINLHPGVHEIYAGVVNGNELQCSRENLEYVVYNPLVAGHEFACYLKSTGPATSNSVYCWGSGDDGHLGSGDTLPNLFNERVEGIIAKFITTGGDHSCAILRDNSVKCWGRGSYGRLGNGDDSDIGDSTDEIANADPVDLGTGRVAKVISAGGRHTCAILDNDRLKCWGRNNEGQLGLGHNDDLGLTDSEMGDNLDPVNLGEGRIAKAIATGDNHTCVILDNDDVKCWGRNNEGQLGLGHTNDYGDSSNETINALSAVNLGTGRTAKAIAAGSYHTCAILDDDNVKCWGKNTEGQLGLGDTDNYGDDETTFPSLDLGEYDHDGDGDDTNPTAEIPFTAKTITAGEEHTCAILSNDQVKCWGLNDQGQLGQNNTCNYGGDDDPTTDGTDSNPDVNESDIAAMPTITLSTDERAISIAAGDKHTCALVDIDDNRNNTDFVIRCWGHNNNGQLGIGDTNNVGDGDPNNNEVADSSFAVGAGGL